MASVTAFTDMMKQFLLELNKTFPKEKAIKKCLNGFEMMVDTNPRILVDKFVESVTPYQDKLSARDESFFMENCDKIEFVKDMNLKTNWPDASEGTKNAIWQYMQTLFMLGMTITSIPNETLQMIENVAKQCADDMQTKDGNINEAGLLNSMQSMLGGMLNKK